ncbi:hypothetical protein ACHQM5_026682 [Ranunculus cassubicifolius]
MSSKSPVFPILEDPQHFSDYGFDPQFDYLQVLEEARKHKKESSRSVEALHFKLQKPISKEENKKRKKKWWKNALLFWRKKWDHQSSSHGGEEAENENGYNNIGKTKYRGYVSGPVYITESRSGSVTPCRVSSRTISGPITGTFGDVDIPYVSLRELNMEPQHRISTSAMPIYLVT